MRVVHCKHFDYTHYIGRPGPFGNPYSHRPSKLAAFRTLTVEDAIRKFEEYARRTPELLARIAALPEDAVLGCWCKVQGDEPCHGDVIVRLWEESRALANNAQG